LNILKIEANTEVSVGANSHSPAICPYRIQLRLEEKLFLMNLHVEVKGQGYPILCLHGHPGSSRSMSVFTDRLSRQFKTLAPDLRGYGKSYTRKNFQMEDHLDDLIRLLDRHKIDRCLLLGWSLGGILSLELVLKYPDRFSGLILIASAARPWSSHPKTTKMELLFTGIAAILNSIKPGWQKNIDLFGKRSLFRYLVYQQTALPYRYLASQGVPAFFKTSAAASRALSAVLQSGYNRVEDLQRIEIPCLILAGDRDRHITAISSQETANKLKNCQWQCYPNTAHLFPWEIPDRVLDDIEQWLEKVGSSSFGS
jgi:pimeloyl-ACP methyl ester carboxylesterase